MILIEHAYSWRSNSKITVSSIRYESRTIDFFFEKIWYIQWTSAGEGTYKWKKHRSEEMKYRKYQSPANKTYSFDCDRHHQPESTCIEQETYVNSCLHFWRYPQIDFLRHLWLNIWWQNDLRWYGIQRWKTKDIRKAASNTKWTTTEWHQGNNLRNRKPNTSLHARRE